MGERVTFRCWCGHEESIPVEDYATPPYGVLLEHKHHSGRIYPMQMTLRSQRVLMQLDTMQGGG